MQSASASWLATWARHFFTLLPLACIPSTPWQEAKQQPARDWEIVLDWIKEQRSRMSADLEVAHSVLYARAENENPDLAKRLPPEAPRPLVWGYGILPELGENDPLKTIQPRETVYSIQSLSTMFSTEFRDAAVLARRAQEQRPMSLTWAVEEFERLKARMANLDQRISYHEFWQKDIAEKPAWYDRRNEIVALARQRRLLHESGTFAERVAELDREIQSLGAPFQPQPGLVIEKADNGTRILRVRVASDIEAPAFLDAFRAAVEETWSQSQAAIAMRFRIELDLQQISPTELYPEGPPERASPIDLQQHLSRFPDGFMVLTTGAKSVHSGAGYVQLDSEKLMPRVLAHEFGHLLGFADAYLRGYAGSPDDPYGLRIIEWTGLMNDLMGGPGVGRVTREMIEQLQAAYDPGQ